MKQEEEREVQSTLISRVEYQGVQYVPGWMDGTGTIYRIGIWHSAFVHIMLWCRVRPHHHSPVGDSRRAQVPLFSVTKKERNISSHKRRDYHLIIEMNLNENNKDVT
jgi:hypothetical protein